ncbi:MAG: alpha-amylase/4-alpha-glucanotransferase domain-containing protein [Candidatus Omnitrophota bacterium]
MSKIKFSMAFHCYQPVFNFDSEFDYAYEKAYLPLLEMFEKHPGIKASFHYPGNMLKWFQETHPEYIDKLRTLIAREQIEIMGGCYYEPVMSMIPDEDRKGQIKRNSSLIQEIFGIRPRGAWVTERVWEPEFAETLINEDMEYTILDDSHLLKAGADKKNLFRPWSIKEKTGELTVFPADRSLRYAMPFSSPEAVLDYMRETIRGSINDKCLFFADDGEKFGAWPSTHKLVYEKRWLDRFFSLLTDNPDLVETYTYSEIMDTVKPHRINTLPTASYGEMMDWSEGDFNNFFTKYPEADRMHKRMMSVSRMLKEKIRNNSDEKEEEGLKKAEIELYKAQSGCAYWHGIFGGVYLPHLRSGVYHHLIKAKGEIEGKDAVSSKRIKAIEYEMGDGDSETVIENAVFDIYLASSDGGGISELDYKPKAVNLVNSMSRIEEKYHKKANWGYFRRMIRARRAIAKGGSADIHDALGIGEKGLKKFLHYDDHTRRSFITHILDKNSSLDKLRTGSSGNRSFLQGKYDLVLGSGNDSIIGTFSKRDKVISGTGKELDLEIEKKVSLNRSSTIDLSHSIRQYNAVGKGEIVKYAIEFNMLIWDKKRGNKTFLTKKDSLCLKDRYSGLIVKFYFDRQCELMTYPVYTVNETERGLKKTFQGISIVVGGELEATKTGLCDHVGIKLEIN